MLTVEDALVKTLTKSQKITFWSQKNDFRCFYFWLTAGDALIDTKVGGECKSLKLPAEC